MHSDRSAAVQLMRRWRRSGVELFVASPDSGGFTRHSHHEYVISANLCGVERVTLDRRQFTVGTDELTLYNPGEVQSGRSEVSDGERWACVSVYVDPDVVADRYAGDVEFYEPLLVAPDLRTRLLLLGLGPVDAAMDESIQRLLDAVFTRARIGARQLDPAEVRAQRWFADVGADPTQPLSVGEIAAHLGWTRETFTRRFTEVTGTPPYAWHLQMRLRRARALLQQGLPPSRVASEAGFADQAHLHRHFRAAYAVTPAQVRGSGLNTPVTIVQEQTQGPGPRFPA